MDASTTRQIIAAKRQAITQHIITLLDALLAAYHPGVGSERLVEPLLSLSKALRSENICPTPDERPPTIAGGHMQSVLRAAIMGGNGTERYVREYLAVIGGDVLEQFLEYVDGFVLGKFPVGVVDLQGRHIQVIDRTGRQDDSIDEYKSNPSRGESFASDAADARSGYGTIPFAVGVLASHPDWNNAQIASASGLHKNSLSNSPLFRAAREAIKSEGRQSHQKADRYRSTNMDEYEDDAESD